MKKEIFLLAAAIMLAGCVANPPEEPKRIAIKYSTGAMHLEWGAYYLTIDEEGQATFTKTKGTSMEKKQRFQTTEEEKIGIYKTAKENNFFSLLDEYEDPAIMDGGWETISITADGQTKTVSMTNYSLSQFEAVANKITKLIKSKLGEDAFSLEDLEEFQATPETCEKLENREQCTEYCYYNICEQELCDTLAFEAEACTACETGCCPKCKNLMECETTMGCKAIWIHPSGESWQYSACENMDFCMSEEALCEELLHSYQGYAYHSSTEENQEKASLFEQMSQELEDLYEEECQEKG